VIFCAGREEVFPFATPIGIGLIQSSINLTEIVIRKKPNFIIFIGSAGSYGRKKIFDIVRSSGAVQIELSYINNNSYTPLKNKIFLTNSIVSHETFINSSNYITQNENFGKYFINKKIDLENMEFYSVLNVAKKFNLPAGGIFVVTNYCDENAHIAYKKNYKKAITILKQEIFKMFPNLHKSC
jgi:nucleoside phosphorylase